MKGRYYEALTDDPMVDVITEQGSMREVPIRLLKTMNLGHAAMSGSVNDPVLKTIRHGWYLAIRMEEDEPEIEPETGKFPMHEGGRS